MISPELVAGVADDWLADQLRGVAADARWLFRRTDPAAVAPPDRPAVVVLGVDPTDPLAAFVACAACAARAPDVAVLVLASAKLSDEPRSAWAAQALDLGARAVLFPPYTRLVLDDLLGGVMAAVLHRFAAPAPARRPDPAPADAPIDLATADHEDPG